nr:hypothetical protein [Tanacetum cinerariifolium]
MEAYFIDISHQISSNVDQDLDTLFSPKHKQWCTAFVKELVDCWIIKGVVMEVRDGLNKREGTAGVQGAGASGASCDGNPKVSLSSPLVSRSTPINMPRGAFNVDVAATFGVLLTTLGDLDVSTKDIEAGKHKELLYGMTNCNTPKSVPLPPPPLSPYCHRRYHHLHTTTDTTPSTSPPLPSPHLHTETTPRVAAATITPTTAVPVPTPPLPPPPTPPWLPYTAGVFGSGFINKGSKGAFVSRVAAARKEGFHLGLFTVHSTMGAFGFRLQQLG